MNIGKFHITSNRVIQVFLLIILMYSLFNMATAAAPNPGHTVDEIDFAGATATTTFGAGIAGTYLNITGTSATSTFARGINLTGGCFSINNTCVGSGSSAATAVSFVPRPVMATGAVAAVAMTSLTSYKIALFTLPYQMTVNQIAYNVGAVTTAGSYRFCVYDEAGTTKLIDVTDVPAANVNTISVSSVTLSPGNYYVAFGCATTCSNTITMWTTTAATWINTSAVPAGKKVYEGTGTMTSGTCNSSLPTITGAISSMPVIRLDN